MSLPFSSVQGFISHSPLHCGQRTLWFHLYSEVSFELTPLLQPWTLLLISDAPCSHQIRSSGPPEFREMVKPHCPPGVYLSLFSLPVSYTLCPMHLPIKVPTLSSWPQALFSGEPQLRHAIPKGHQKWRTAVTTSISWVWQSRCLEQPFWRK